MFIHLLLKSPSRRFESSQSSCFPSYSHLNIELLKYHNQFIHSNIYMCTQITNVLIKKKQKQLSGGLSVSGEEEFLRRLVSARFECPYCDYRCFRKYDLDRHVRKHTGEKPYGCNQCEMKYSRLEHLKSHIKAKHMCQISPLV